MIKSLTIVRQSASAKQHKALAKLLDQLGFGKGRDWSTETSAGASFLAPVGNLELCLGNEIQPDLWVEVTDIESVHTLAKKSGAGEVDAVTATSWKSRLFHLRSGNLHIAFWQYDQPPKLPFQTVEGELWVTGARIGIVVSRFNSFITERLLQGALDALRRTGTKEKDIVVVRVPGAFEVPIGARSLALSKKDKVDAVICLGVLMRGETSNYEHISDEVARGIGQAAQASGKPCTYGVLTCDTLEQAIDRAGLKMGNKGFEAALAAVEMVSAQGKLKSSRRGQKRKVR
ncbi:MAG: 6,7-dimethyl-8-ribityllumazine synthase [Acidobacteriales bacterium]|nr:6,7-dimethyl-8-ribityllumazine synthase [Terriglobales bacterium]